METLFSGAPIETTIFYYDGSEIAYVVLEDEGDYWSILASLGDVFDEKGATQQVIDKSIYHPSPKEYAKEQYDSVVRLVTGLLLFNGTADKVEVERRIW
jgi:predicted cupin superfamily sugar epimerase